MPSIEVVCFDQATPTEFSHLPFAVEASTTITSHRRPTSLFAKDFAALRGCIYHLGNPSLKTAHEQRTFFAYDLIADHMKEVECPDVLQFNMTFEEAVHDLLASLLSSSPVQRLLFTSDWQFGPKQPFRSEAVTLEYFWELHDSGRLRLNAAYPIVG